MWVRVCVCIGARVCVGVCVCLCWCAYVEMFPFVFSPRKIAEGTGPTGDRVCVALYGNPIPYPDLTLSDLCPYPYPLSLP